MIATVQTLAYDLSQALVDATRDSGARYVKLQDGSPEWMTDAIHAAHGDMMPDDWRYRAIRDVAGFIAEIDDGEYVREDHVHECCDQLVDVYNADLTAWLASSLNRLGYCDQAVDDGLVEMDAGMSKRLQIGQYVEYQEIFFALSLFLDEQADD